jgi:thioredoxin-dependent peroxiredoxin
MMKLLILIALITITVIGYQSFSKTVVLPFVGDKAPEFNLPDANGKTRTLADYSQQWLALYFYPKDDTPGCTKEACHFRDDLAKLEKLGAKVVGVSVDDSLSHVEFAKKYNLPFPLLSDKDGLVASKYGALSNLGIVKIAKRYTFLIDPEGRIAKVYLSVDTSRHSQEIIDDLTRLKAK